MKNRTAGGQNNNQVQKKIFPVAEFAGARLTLRRMCRRGKKSDAGEAVPDSDGAGVPNLFVSRFCSKQGRVLYAHRGFFPFPEIRQAGAGVRKLMTERARDFWEIA